MILEQSTREKVKVKVQRNTPYNMYQGSLSIDTY